MSLDLVDVRFKLPVDLNAVLDAIAESLGKEKSTIARQFVEEALNKQLHTHRCIQYELNAIGLGNLLGDSQGNTGKK